MTRAAQVQIQQQLKAQGYQGRVHQHGKSWRISVTPVQLHEHTWREWDRLSGQYQKVTNYLSREATVRQSETLLLSWFQKNGYPWVRVLRRCSTDILFELDHPHNIWKTLQNL